MELEIVAIEVRCGVVGPARTMADAARLAVNEPGMNVAILDVNLSRGDLPLPCCRPAADAQGAAHLRYWLLGHGASVPSCRQVARTQSAATST